MVEASPPCGTSEFEELVVPAEISLEITTLRACAGRLFNTIDGVINRAERSRYKCLPYHEDFASDGSFNKLAI
jgi:hypothetical protein